MTDEFKKALLEAEYANMEKSKQSCGLHSFTDGATWAYINTFTDKRIFYKYDAGILINTIILIWDNR
jgi:hypothetical protein